MEGVEDIPGTALAEGIEWEWETFPEYLDALERRRWTVDVGTQVPHGAVRAYVMGERGARNEAATAEDIDGDARPSCSRRIRAGALGFSTSRTMGHRAIDGELVPGHVRRRGRAVRHRRPRWPRPAPASSSWRPSGSAGEHARRRRGRRSTGCAGSRPPSTAPCPTCCSRSTTIRSCGASSWPPRSRPAPRAPALYPQIAGRPTGHPVRATTPRSASSRTSRPTWRCGSGACRSTPSSRRRWPTPRCGASIVSWTPSSPAQAEAMEKAYGRTFVLGDPPDYEPGPERSLAGLAAARGVSPLGGGLRRDGRDDGQGLLYLPILNYATGDLDHVREMLLHPAGPARALRRWRPHRHDLRRVDADVHAHALDPRPRPRRHAAVASTWSRSRRTTRRASTACRTAARWSPARWPTSTSSTTTASALGAPYVRTTCRPAARRLLQKADGYVATIKKGDRDLRGRRGDRGAARPPGTRRPLRHASAPTVVAHRAERNPYGRAADRVRAARRHPHRLPGLGAATRRRTPSTCSSSTTGS